MKSTRGHMLIFYGTTSGTSSKLAFDLSLEAAKYQFIPTIVDLFDFDPEVLMTSKLAVFLLSTYGSGGPPFNSQEFFNWVSENATKIKLKYLNYGIFGLGNKTFEHFCGMSVKVDAFLQQMEAVQISPLYKGDADAQTTQSEFDQWREQFWPSVLNQYPIFQISEEQYHKISNPSKFAAILQDQDNLDAIPNQISNEYKQYQESYEYSILKIQELRKNPQFGNSTINISLATNHTYRGADNIFIFPENLDEQVEKLISVLNINKNQKIVFQPSNPNVKLPIPQNTSVGVYLKKFADINAPLSKLALFELSKFLNDQELIRKYQSWSTYEKREEYEQYNKEIGLSFYTFVTENNIQPPISMILQYVGFIRPRSYTISSSSLKNPKSIDIITSSHVIHPLKPKLGLASNYFQHLLKNPVNIKGFVKQSMFQLPKNSQAPIILVGIGAGLAPLLAFIQEKDQHIENNTLNNSQFQGPMILYFGCRSDEDFICKEELMKYKENGTLDQLHVAYSRQNEKKVYVQDLLRENIVEINDKLMLQHGVLYICGSEKMGRQVCDVVAEIFKKFHKTPPYQAFNKVNALEKEGRICKELFG